MLVGEPLENSYEIDIDYGYALLEELDESEYAYRPEEGDDVYDNIFHNALWGGEADPEEDQDFVTFSLEWPEEVEEPDHEMIDNLTEMLDEMFAGWVLNEDHDRVYVLVRML